MRDDYRAASKDMKTAPIQVDQAKKVLEEEYKCKYLECSALTRVGLKEVFDEAIRTVMQKKVKPMGRKSSSESS